MSSSLCKNLEGAIFPLQVEAVELRSLAFKWIRILFRCWQERTPYNEQIYLQALARRGSPLLPQLPAAVNPN